MTKKTPSKNILLDIVCPPHESQKCGAKARSTGQPCRRWASIGYTRCRFHGGAKGSGRPATHGKRSAQGQRNERFVRIVSGILHRYYEVPEPVECDARVIPGEGDRPLI